MSFVFQLFIVPQYNYLSVLTTIHFLHPAQSCTITPLNPTTLTATGGALVSGTTDVRIQCVCTETIVRWYNPSMTIIVTENHQDHGGPNSPYVIRDSNNMDITLVIPTFNDSFDGKYNCGIRVSNTEFTSPSAAVTLTIGELMINTVSYLYVCSNIVTLSN